MKKLKSPDIQWVTNYNTSKQIITVEAHIKILMT